MRLKDKVAIITGGGQGIGRIFALRFAQEGANVAIADINLDNAQMVSKEIVDCNGKALPIFADVSKEDSTLEMAKITVERFGHLDILVNNAAYYYGLKRIPWNAWSIDDWNRLWAVNVVGVWQCIKATVPYMIKRGTGKIINVTSSVVYTGQPFILPYNCSKGAVAAMTRALANELGQYNINVNSIAPGFTLTDASNTAYPPEEIEQRKENIRNSRSIKRDEQPNDLAGTAVFLASNDSDFITGTSIPVNGGEVML